MCTELGMLYGFQSMHKLKTFLLYDVTIVPNYVLETFILGFEHSIMTDRNTRIYRNERKKLNKGFLPKTTPAARVSTQER